MSQVYLFLGEKEETPEEPQPMEEPKKGRGRKGKKDADEPALAPADGDKNVHGNGKSKFLEKICN